MVEMSLSQKKRYVKKKRHKYFYLIGFFIYIILICLFFIDQNHLMKILGFFSEKNGRKLLFFAVFFQ